MLHDRNFQLQSEQKHFVFGIIPFKKQKAGDTYVGCKTKPFAVKQINKMKHHALYLRLVAQFSQHDEDFSPLANDSATPYRGNQSAKTSSWSGAKTDDSSREGKFSSSATSTCYGLLRVSVTFSFIKYCFPLIIRGLWTS